MARWMVSMASSEDWGLVPTGLLSTLVFCIVCVSAVLALCAARSNPDVDPNQSFEREPEGELGREQAVETRKLQSHRFSSTAAITKLGASFRIASFRNDFPGSTSFRFRTDCKSQVDVVDGLRRVRPAAEAEEPAVWQRVILRGERCAPLSFSGVILYDVHGNPLPSNAPEQDSSDLED